MSVTPTFQETSYKNGTTSETCSSLRHALKLQQQSRQFNLLQDGKYVRQRVTAIGTGGSRGTQMLLQFDGKVDD